MRDLAPITLHETPRAYHVRGGTWEFTLSRASGLLERAVVRGDSWLAGPVPDLWASGAVDPRGDSYCARYSPATTARVVSAGGQSVALRSEGTLARVDGATIPLRWQLDYAFAADGTVRVDVTVRTTGQMALRWLSLGRAEADRGSCRFLVHEGDAGSAASSCRPTCHALAEGDYEAAGRFIPWAHFGNDRGGLDLVFPHSDRGGWSWTDSSPYPTGDPLGRAGDRMLVRAQGGRASFEVFALRNLYEPVDEGWEYTDTFYLSAVPGKGVDPRANDLRVWWPGPHQFRGGWAPPGEEDVVRWAAAGANTVIGGANWRSGDYSHPDRPEETARFVDLCHRYGMRVLPYLTFTDMEFGAPAFEARGREWRIEPAAEFSYRSHLMCYGAEGWQEHWEREVAAAWEMLPFDGLYIDFWASRLVCRNARHGCVGPHGRFNAGGLRRMAQYAGELVRGRDGLIVANCNVLPLAMLNNWFDARLLGEWHNLEETEGLPTRVFHNAHRYGCANLLLVSKIPHLTERTLALTAAYQGSPVLSHARTPAERDLLSRRARLLASFGTGAAAARNAFERPSPEGWEGVQVSAYHREDNGHFLVTLSRVEAESVTVSLSGLPEVCGALSGRWLVFCAETGAVLGGRALGVADLADVALEVPGESLRTLWLRPDPGAPCLLCALTGGDLPATEWDPEGRRLSFTLAHPARETAEVALAGPAPASLVAGEQSVAFAAGQGCVTATVPCNVPVVATYPPPRLPQLRMRFTRFDALPEMAPPQGYEIRRYRPGDEAAWAAVLTACGSLGKWDVDRVVRLLQSERHAVPEGTFFATWKGMPVAATCSVVGPANDRWEIGWVAVDPEHQGHRLSYWTCLACLHYMRSQGATEAYLLTDDFRVPAIKTYLRLGFEPQIADASHPGRWRKILAEIG